MYLPPELVELVVLHCSAMRIQRIFRKHQFSHARLPIWGLLRARLCASMRRHQFDDLQRNAAVRKEWKNEPESWMDADKATLECIHDEVCKLKLW